MKKIRENNAILADCDIANLTEFHQELARLTNQPWQIRICISNKARTKKAYNLYRYMMYFLFPLRVFLGRKQYEGGTVIGWQQFYATLLAFYCRLFRVKKRFHIIVMAIVYKRKSGWLGGLYHRFMKYALGSQYIDCIMCTSTAEVTLLAEALDIPQRRLQYVPWGAVDHMKTTPYDATLADRRLCFSPGRSNRDFDFIINSLRDASYPVLIACDTMRPGVFGSVTVDNSIDGDAVRRYMRNAYCALVVLDNPNVSAGHTILLQAFCFGVPIIITKSKGLSDDYIVDGYNGLVVEKTPEALLHALDRLYNDPALYRTLSENSLTEFHEKYTKTALGKHIGEIVLRLRAEHLENRGETR